MISNSGGNFFAAHYDWLALAVGALVLAGGAALFVLSLGNDADQAVAAETRRVAAFKPDVSGVRVLDMSELKKTLHQVKSPTVLTDVPERDASFLASEPRVICAGKDKDGKPCGRALLADAKICPECPFCGTKRKIEAKAVLDKDGDGMPDDWERRYGLNPNDPSDAAQDGDKDEFTNLEEFRAKTDPTDRKDHPDYLDSLKIQPPLKATYMPFVFLAAIKIPSGWRCDFFDAKQKDDYGRLGRTFKAAIGEEIGKSGYVLRAYEKKEVRRAFKGGQGLTKAVDVSEATVERKSDGKKVTLVISESKKAKPMPVDVQATLVYERGQTKTFEVVTGDVITLSGVKYKIAEVSEGRATARPQKEKADGDDAEKNAGGGEGKTARITIENVLSGKKRILQALEQ